MIDNRKDNNSVQIYIIIFILTVCTIIALFDVKEKLQHLKVKVYIITNKVDSLIEKNNER